MRRTIRFWVWKNLFSTSDLESWLTKIGKVLIVVRYFNIPTFPSRKLRIWRFYQGLSWRWYIFKFFSQGTINSFVPYIGTLIGCTCENVHLIPLFCWFLDSIIFEAVGLNSSTKVSIEMFFCQYRIFFKKSDLLYVRSFFFCTTSPESIEARLVLNWLK